LNEFRMIYIDIQYILNIATGLEIVKLRKKKSKFYKFDSITMKRRKLFSENVPENLDLIHPIYVTHQGIEPCQCKERRNKRQKCGLGSFIQGIRQLV